MSGAKEGARAVAVLNLQRAADASTLTALLAELDHSAVSVVVWQVDAEPALEAELFDAIRRSAFFFQPLADAALLEPGALYVTPANCRVWFEGDRLRVGLPSREEPFPFDRVLRSLAQVWGPRSIVMLSTALADDGERGVLAVREAGGAVLEARSVGAERRVAPSAVSGRGGPASSSEVCARSSGAPRPAKPTFRAPRFFPFGSALLELLDRAARTVRAETAPRGRTRVWVPGCRTGGLVYGTAMLLSEAVPPAQQRLQVFGTDADEEALAVARTGRYPVQSALGLNPELRGRYTLDEGQTIRIAEALREQCVFSRHKLTRDAPLARMDLIVCHRVFDGVPASRRSEAMDALHFSLREGGMLVALDHRDQFPRDRFEVTPEGYLRARSLRVRPALMSPRFSSGPLHRASATWGRPARSSLARRPADTRKAPRSGDVGLPTELELFVRAIGAPLLVLDQQLYVKYVSAQACQLFGVSIADQGSRLQSLLGRLPGELELMHAVERARATDQTREIVAHTRNRTYLARISSASRVGGQGIIILFTDVTALEAATAQAMIQRHQQAAVARIGDLALSVASVDVLFEEALSVLFGNIPVCSGGVVLERRGDGSDFEVVASRGLGPDPLDALARWGEPLELIDLVRTRAVFDHPADGASRAATTRRFREVTLGALPRKGAAEPTLGTGAQGSAARPTAGVACPIVNEGVVLGIIALYAREPGIEEPTHRPFMQAIANVLGGALARQRTRRRLALELELGSAAASASSLGELGDAVLCALRNVTGAESLEIWMPNVELGGRWRSEFPFRLPADELPWPEGVLETPGPHFIASRGSERPDLWLPVTGRHGPLAVFRVRGPALYEPDAELSQGLERSARMLAFFMERLHIMQALQESEASYRQRSAELEALYTSLPVGVSIHDRDGAIQRVNRHLAELEGGASNGASCPLRRLYADELPRWIERVLTTGQPIHDVELTLSAGHDQQSWLCNFAPIGDVHGTMFGVSAVVQDITRLKRIEASLREADRQKDDFLAILGHELRNPMAAIRNATELLSRIEKPTPQLLRLQSIFDRQTLQTTKLIDGLLDVARVARGKVELAITKVQVGELLRQVIDDRRHQFRDRSLDLRLSEAELWADADRVRLVQVLDNLLSNALKFTAPGGVIRVELERIGSRGSIVIADDGVGIEPDLLPNIFEPFRQGRAEVPSAQAGLGLGLALVKGLVELHGFELHADSRGRGHGASFRIEFPLTRPAESRPPESRVNARRLDLLLVEDNVDIADTLAELLGSAGHRVRCVASGEAALDALRSGRPDIVLCDIGLPGIDGLAVAAHIRKEPSLSDLKLIAMTGFGDASTRQRIEAAGFDRYLIKPVQLEALSQCLARLAPVPANVNRV